MRKPKKNKLNIYLIKSDVSEKDIVISDTRLKPVLVDDIKIYIKPSQTKVPLWIESFFGSSLSGRDDIYSSTPSLIMIVPVKIDKKNRYFVITFGTGFHLMEKGIFEERFGLKTVLNIVDPENIRSIDKRNLGALGKQTKEQAGKSADATEFNIDIEQDLMQAVTGLSKDLELGKTISGKDSLHISSVSKIENIKELLRKCFEYSELKTYKERFPWIDYIAEIKDPNKIFELNNDLLHKVNSRNTEKLWISVPEIIEWADFNYFRYGGGIKSKDYFDLSFDDFLEEHERIKSDFTIDKLKLLDVYCFFENSSEKRWRVYDCIYTEINKGKNLYTLTNGKWYQVDNNFSKSTEKEYLEIISKTPPTVLPDCPVRKEDNNKAVREDKYNKYATDKINGVLLDKQTVMHVGSPIEICDIYSKDKEFFHVKHYGGSSVLSHLFNQGVVSAELFSREVSFRKSMNNKTMKPEFEIKNPSNGIDTSDYSVIYGIISNYGKNLDLPFFSKVSLKNAVSRLKMYGYNVYVQKIGIDKNTEIKS